MIGFLRQSTASQSRMIGPFIDDTDFKTTKTGLTIANTDIKLSANGGAGASKNSGGGTHRNNGMYGITLDATDSATVGELAGSVVVASALPVVFKFIVVEEAVYDALFVASAPGYVVDQPVNTTKIGGTSQTGRDVGASVLLSSGTGTGQVSLSSGLVRLSATGVDDILDEVVEGSYTVRQYLRGYASALFSKCSGMATTTAVFKDTGDTKTRISATVDTDGNRTAIGTLDLT